MTFINCEDVSLTVPVYDFNSQSIRRKLINTAIGGSIDTRVDIVSINVLNSVNVTMQPGDRVAVHGHNGAGKSSFLRLLSGIYPPSEGRFTYEGVVRAILSNSDGMEASLSGRENIYRIGLMRNLSIAEIKLCEEEIIAFSGLGDFIDFPVRTYSSGMQMRLIFSVITSGYCDILLLDEFFATGDADFMKKAKNRIEKFIENTDILVFAAHSKPLLLEYCNRFLIFERGNVIEITKSEFEN